MRTRSVDTSRSPHLANLADSDLVGSFATPHKHKQLNPEKLLGLLPSKLTMNSNLNKSYKSHLRANRKFKLLHVWEPKCCWNKREVGGQGEHCAWSLSPGSTQEPQAWERPLIVFVRQFPGHLLLSSFTCLNSFLSQWPERQSIPVLPTDGNKRWKVSKGPKCGHVAFSAQSFNQKKL